MPQMLLSSLAVAVIAIIPFISLSPSYAFSGEIPAEPQALGRPSRPSDDTEDLQPGSVEIEGTYETDELFIRRWTASVTTSRDGRFQGTASFPGIPDLPPLLVSGTRFDDVVSFSITLSNGEEVATFAGNLAGTDLVGTFHAITGETKAWSGSWMPRTVANERLDP